MPKDPSQKPNKTEKRNSPQADALRKNWVERFQQMRQEHRKKGLSEIELQVLKLYKERMERKAIMEKLNLTPRDIAKIRVKLIARRLLTESDSVDINWEQVNAKGQRLSGALVALWNGEKKPREIIKILNKNFGLDLTLNEVVGKIHRLREKGINLKQKR